jgi:hypothetical protein
LAQRQDEFVLKRFFTFSMAIWLLAAVAVFALIGLPPAQDAWAYFFWEKVPCRILANNPGNSQIQKAPDGPPRGFLYVYKGVKYTSPRMNFWYRRFTQSSVDYASTESATLDRTCYVSPGNPWSAVLALDAHRHFDRAADSLFLAAFVICVATVLSFLTRKRHRRQLSS